MKDKNLQSLRGEIDSIDDQLLNLIVKRTSIVDEIGVIKKNQNNIVDKKRESEVISRLLNLHKGNFSNMSNVNNVIEIEELERWILDDKVVLDNNLKPHLHYIRKRINFLKTMKYINEWQLAKAIKNIFLLPLGFLKIKLILYIILPKKILDILKKY